MKWELVGDTHTLLLMEMSRGESVKCQAGAMAYKFGNIQRNTRVEGGLMSAISRTLSNESFFQNIYTSYGEGTIAFSSDMPGTIKHVDITPNDPMIVQKNSILVLDMGIQMRMYFKKDVFTGLFGGEGFILNELYGHGSAFLNVDGRCIQYTLEPHQEIEISTSHFFAMSSTCSMELKVEKGISNVLFGGEGLVNTRVRGPGRVLIQTTPMVNQLAGMTRQLSKEEIGNQQTGNNAPDVISGISQLITGFSNRQ